jgi:hypothetical protein
MWRVHCGICMFLAPYRYIKQQMCKLRCCMKALPEQTDSRIHRKVYRVRAVPVCGHSAIWNGIGLPKDQATFLRRERWKTLGSDKIACLLCAVTDAVVYEFESSRS